MQAVASSLPTLNDPAIATAFDRCYRAHRHDVYRLGLRYGAGRRAWAEDVTHDVFIKLLEHLPRLRDTTDLAGWLYRVTANTCISRLRREQSFLARLRPAVSLDPDADADAKPSPETDLTAKQTTSAALAAFAALPARERVVLSMKVLDGKTQRDIASVLDMSEGYVSKLLARAWKRLRAAGWEVSDDQA
jgi:RNA polymerase sigma factor (sigma-70 family)